MNPSLSSFVGLIFNAGAFLLIANEIRGLILAVPVLYGIVESGGTWIALWVGFCSLAGIALSMIVPAVVARRFLRRNVVAIK